MQLYFKMIDRNNVYIPEEKNEYNTYHTFVIHKKKSIKKILKNLI